MSDAAIILLIVSAVCFGIGVFSWLVFVLTGEDPVDLLRQAWREFWNEGDEWRLW